MLNGGNISVLQRQNLWAEAFNIATQVENGLVKIGVWPSAFCSFFVKGETKIILSSLLKFGEKCIDAKREKL